MQPLLRAHRRRVVFHVPSPPLTTTAHGFTLIELLVVLAVVVILVAIALPIVDRPLRSRATQCLNNTKQMTLGWMLYAQDNQDVLVANEPYVGATAITNNWIGGVMDWSVNLQNTNTALLLTNRLGDYIKSAAVYRCPADESASAAGPRVRSYAMNAFMNSSSNRVASAGWKQFRKLQEIRKPTATFVIVDEHANSIDDGYFLNDPNLTNSWQSLPAANHHGAAAGFSFAEGHAEIHKWVEADTKQPVVPGGLRPVVTIPSRKTAVDLAWVLERTTYPDTNAVALP